MTRKELEIILPFMNALAEGKIIQRNDPENGTDDWWDMEVVDFTDLESIVENPSSYRIKRVLTYRPFKDGAECWEEMQKHEPFGWARKKYNPANKAVGIDEVNGFVMFLSGESMDYGEAFEKLTFIDGTPFGKKEEL